MQGDVSGEHTTVAGAAKILGIDETDATVKFQSQTFDVAHYCVWKKVGEMDAEKADLNPSQAQPGPW